MTDSISPEELEALYELQVNTTLLLQHHLKSFAERAKRASPSAANIARANRPMRDPLAGLAPGTVKNYRRRSEQLFRVAREKGESVWETLERSTSNKDSHRTGKVQVVACTMHEMLKTKRRLDDLGKSWKAGLLSEEERQELERCIDALVTYATVLETLPEQPPSEMSKGGQQSKSKSRRNLPEDWEEQVALRLKPSTALQWLVEASSGCRPEEIAKGVSVELSDDRREITFEIAGAKYTQFAGQKWRRFSVSADEGAARMLAERLSAPGRHVVSLDITTGAYSKRIWRVSRKLWPNRSATTTPTPYSARHQMKANLRAAGVPSADRAKVLGHSTTGSDSYYGGRGSSSAVTPSKIEVERDVRVVAGYATERPRPAPMPSMEPPPAPKPRRKPKR